MGVEKGRYAGVPWTERCERCDEHNAILDCQIDDELHVLHDCETFNNARTELLLHFAEKSIINFYFSGISICRFFIFCMKCVDEGEVANVTFEMCPSKLG